MGRQRVVGRRRLRSGPGRGSFDAKFEQAYQIALRERREDLERRGFVEWGKGRGLSDLSPHAKPIFGRNPLCKLLARVGHGGDKEYWVQEWALCVYNAFKHRYPLHNMAEVSTLIRAMLERLLPDEEEDLRLAILAADALGGLEGGRAVYELLTKR